MAGLKRVAGVGLDGSTVSTTLGKLVIPLLKASYGDKLKKEKLSYMGSQKIDEVTQGTYECDDAKITMSSLIFRTVFMEAMPLNGGGNVKFPLVIGLSHPDLGDDSDLLENCQCTNLGAAVENSAKAFEVELELMVQQVKWTDKRKTINQILQAGQIPAGAIASGF